MKDVVVIAGTAVGSVLSIIEGIKKHYDINAYVICLSEESKVIFESSKMIYETLFLTASSSSAFKENIERWYLKNQFQFKPILYFTTDTSCYLISQYRNWFEERFIMCLPSNEIINIYTQKGIAELDAKKHGLDIPKTSTIDNMGDVYDIINSFNFPVIIKPKSTYNSKSNPFKVKLLDKLNFKEVVSIYLKDGYDFVCQEFIPGEDASSYFYLFYRSKSGKVNDLVGRKILQNPPRAGIMAKGVIEEHNDLTNVCRKFISNIDYVGIGGIEFKKFNEKYYFIEMSTRLEGFFKISNFSTYPISINSYEDLSNEVTFNENIINIYGSVYYDVIATLMSRIRSNKIILIPLDLFSIFFGKNKVINVFSSKDTRPFFRTLKSILKIKL